MKEMLHIVDPHELCEDLVVVVDPPRPVVRHPETDETILHVDESRKTVARTSTVDGPVSLV